MKNGLISMKTLEFLRELRTNNNREWFTANKEKYLQANEEIKVFLSSLTEAMNRVDEIEKNKLFRIYRDVRFSKDKTPYKDGFSMSMSRAKPYLRGGYYVRISPGESALACGFWNPNPHDLNLIRKNIEIDSSPLRKILSSDQITENFKGLEGEKVKSAPKGYSKDHPDIDLIRYKQLILSHSFKDEEVCSGNFKEEVVRIFSAARPWFDYMSDILSHNLNGEALY